MNAHPVKGGTTQFIFQQLGFGFGCRVFVRKGTRSNIPVKVETENNMEVAKAETNEDVDSILVHECKLGETTKTPKFDAHPTGNFVSILVFQLQVDIFCFILMHISC